jgi:hypothetical protein
LISHLTAPAQVLGPPPELQPRHDLIVGASQGSAADHVMRLEEVIRRQYQDESPGVLRPLLKSEVPASLYIDASEFSDWKAFLFDGSEYRLVIDSRFVIANGGS